MGENDIFMASTRSTGDLSGIYEYDEDVGYFYLYQIDDSSTNTILAAVRVVSGPQEFVEDDIDIRWNHSCPN